MIDVVSYLNTGLAPQSDRVAEKDLGKDAFMQLLISQMSYQNPLEPMENTEFVAQLAQFSALEQQQNIAAGIEMLALSQTASTNSQMVNLIGKRVVVPGNGLTIDDEEPVKINFDVDGEASPMELVIRDENGNIVSRVDLTDVTVGANQFEFDGKDDSGNFLAPGNYSYMLLDQAGQPVEGVTTHSNFLVDAVAFSGTSILLKSDDTTIDLGDISEVIRN